MKTEKMSGAFQVLVGAGMIGIWILNFINGSIPQFQTEPWSITTHILAETITATLLLASGLSILLKGHKLKSLYYIAFGSLIYTLIASPGYFAQLANWPAVVFFLVLLLITIALLLGEKRINP